MFSLANILLPVDFSERCIGAARYAEVITEHFGSEVTLVHVVPTPHYELSGMESGGALLSELYARREEALENEVNQFLRRELPNLEAKRMLLKGDPARRIVGLAELKRTNLIMMPTHGYGGFRRFILGSVTAIVLHDADCPVWTGVHMEEAPEVERIHFRTIVVGVDLGPQSEKTLIWAGQFACWFDARLVLVHAIPGLEGQVGEYLDREWYPNLTREAYDRMANLQRLTWTTAEEYVEPGDPPSVVCEAAKRLNADLLVIGRGSAAGIFGRLRTNAYSIIRQSPCPVVSV